MHCWFQSWIQKSDHVMTLCDEYISVIRKVASQFVYKFVDFRTLSCTIQSYTCYREELNRCKIHHMDTICLLLATFEEFAMITMITFQSAAETNST